MPVFKTGALNQLSHSPVRVAGFEPASVVWKTTNLPLIDTRKIGITGFEPMTFYTQNRRDKPNFAIFRT
jgi:hypothetical protein